MFPAIYRFLSVLLLKLLFVPLWKHSVKRIFFKKSLHSYFNKLGKTLHKKLMLNGASWSWVELLGSTPTKHAQKRKRQGSITVSEIDIFPETGVFCEKKMGSTKHFIYASYHKSRPCMVSEKLRFVEFGLFL